VREHSLLFFHKSHRFTRPDQLSPLFLISAFHTIPVVPISFRGESIFFDRLHFDWPANFRNALHSSIGRQIFAIGIARRKSQIEHVFQHRAIARFESVTSRFKRGKKQYPLASLMLRAVVLPLSESRPNLVQRPK